MPTTSKEEEFKIPLKKWFLTLKRSKKFELKFRSKLPRGELNCMCTSNLIITKILVLFFSRCMAAGAKFIVEQFSTATKRFDQLMRDTFSKNMSSQGEYKVIKCKCKASFRFTLDFWRLIVSLTSEFFPPLTSFLVLVVSFNSQYKIWL